MARHEKLSERTGLKVYFAHPHSPWERGRNENTNGLLRQHLPKGEDLNGYSQQQLDAIAASLNARPRKSLGWKAPSELFLPKGAFDFNKYWSTSTEINLAADQSNVTLEDCDLRFRGREEDAALLFDTSSANIHRCKIHDSTSIVTIKDGGTAKFVDCEVWACSNVAFWVEDAGSSLTLKQCKVRDSGNNCVVAAEQTLLLIEDCEFQGSGKECPALLFVSCDAKIRRCNIHDTLEGGVVIAKGATVEVTG